jgi:hypothetical protein
LGLPAPRSARPHRHRLSRAPPLTENQNLGVACLAEPLPVHQPKRDLGGCPAMDYTIQSALKLLVRERPQMDGDAGRDHPLLAEAASPAWPHQPPKPRALHSISTRGPSGNWNRNPPASRRSNSSGSSSCCHRSHSGIGAE